MSKVKLYNVVNGQARLVDFGIMESTELYRARGYVVRPAAENDSEPVWKAPVVERKITVCHRIRKPKVSIWKKISNFVEETIGCLIPQPAYA